MGRGSLNIITLPYLAIFLILFAIAIPFSSAIISDKLKPGFYGSTCPQVEKVIFDVMKHRSQQNEGIVPGILRLHFHDCFITGCDATILFTPERYNLHNSEMGHPANSISLRGMDVLNEAKAILEKQCPNTVSCADLLAYAARDAIVLAGNPTYTVPAGRRDGLIIDGNLAAGLPKGVESIPVLKSKYEERGLTLEDMIVLEGAHSIGQTRCLGTIAVPGSLNNVTDSEQIMDKNLQKMVETKYCFGDPNLFFNKTAPLNPEKGDSDWGVSFYHNIIKGYSLIPCDLGMAVDPTTKVLVQRYANDSNLWKNLFNEAMVKLGKVNVLTGDEGEIRRDCRYLNAVNTPN